MSHTVFFSSGKSFCAAFESDHFADAFIFIFHLTFALCQCTFHHVPCFPFLSDLCGLQFDCSTRFSLNVLHYVLHNFHLFSEYVSLVIFLSFFFSSFFICVFYRSCTVLNCEFFLDHIFVRLLWLEHYSG